MIRRIIRRRYASYPECVPIGQSYIHTVSNSCRQRAFHWVYVVELDLVPLSKNLLLVLPLFRHRNKSACFTALEHIFNSSSRFVTWFILRLFQIRSRKIIQNCRYNSGSSFPWRIWKLSVNWTKAPTLGIQFQLRCFCICIPGFPFHC